MIVNRRPDDAINFTLPPSQKRRIRISRWGTAVVCSVHVCVCVCVKASLAFCALLRSRAATHFVPLIPYTLYTCHSARRVLE